MKRIWWFSVITLLHLSVGAFSQERGAWEDRPELTLSGFLDVFYVYDFARPEGPSRQPFFFNHNRHNEFNLNLGFIQWNVSNAKYRANLALQSGTYPNDNYAEEPGLLKAVLEANVGISLNANNSLWLDMGIMPSHIGFESAISMDNPTLTRSILAENSPYFMAGAKLGYQPNEKWYLAGLILNGWQRIQRLPGNSIPSFGSQVTFTPTEGMTFNWSTFVGTNDPDSTRRMRYFNNFFGKFQLSEKLALTAGFDLGLQQSQKGSSSLDPWFSPVVIAQYKIQPHWRTAIRAEFYQDRTGIMIPTETANGFQTLGISGTLDFLPTDAIMLRTEARWLNSQDRIFESPNGNTSTNFFVGVSLAARFNKTWAD